MGRYSAERNKNGLQLIQKVLQLTSSDSASEDVLPGDIVLVAIDFENPNAITPRGEILNTGIEVGLAILDTNNLKPTFHDSNNIISTYNFAAGSSKFGAAASRRFIFGESSTITTADILSSIEGIVPRSRNVILIGFELACDLITLRRLKFDLKSSIYGIIDTAWVAKEVLPSFRGALEDLLCFLKCPFGQLHCAGNDAHFTLRALLLLAVWDKSQNMLVHDQVTLLKKIAHDPIQSSYIKEPVEQEIAVTKAIRKKRNNLATKARRRALSEEEKERGRAAFEEEQRRSAAKKSTRQLRSKQIRESNHNAQERIRAERAQRRENYLDVDLDDLGLLSQDRYSAD